MIEKIRRLSEQAGEEIMKYYRGGNWTVSTKTDESPLTQADLAANDIIIEGLKQLTNEPIVSEESDPASASAPGEAPFWLVDPLDGTRDFVNRLDSFVVCIARVVRCYPVLGVIHSPVTGETWWAEAGRGAYSSKGKRLMHRGKREVLIAAGSRSHPSDRMQKFYDMFSIQEVHRYGSALKFCRLAEGDIDLYPRFGPTSEWDTAAGQVIAEESGCKVIEVSSAERLRYGKPGFANQGGFVASRADLDIVPALLKAGLLKR